MLSRFEYFIYDIAEIELYWHRLSNKVMKKYGLKGTHCVYFVKLYKNKDGVTGVELASMCGKDKADVSRDMAFLEDRGFIKRVKPGNGVYRARITLTEEGEKITKEISAIAEKAVGIVVEGLEEEDKDSFHKVLDTITENLHMLSERWPTDSLL